VKRSTTIQESPALASLEICGLFIYNQLELAATKLVVWVVWAELIQNYHGSPLGVKRCSPKSSGEFNSP